MRARHRGIGARVGHAVGLLVMAGGSSMAAQLPNASPAATGLGGAYIARARGYDAVAWNPANLGLPGNPGFSLGLVALQGASGLDPISLSDFAPYSGKVLPASQRETWLQTVAAKGGENGRVDAGITFVALSAGPFALQVASSVTGSTELSADAFEAILFGNAGRTGSPKSLSLEGSSLRVGAFTTAAASYGASLGSHLALGVTGKYIVGNALGMAEDQGTATTADAVTVNFPLVYSHPDSDIVAGSGLGLDLGLAWSLARFSFGATVQNVFNTFAWDAAKLRFKPGTATINGDANNSDFDDQAYANAPASLRARVADDKFAPIIAAGVAFAASSSITFSADWRQQTGDAMLLGPKTQASGGLEFRGIPALRLRGGGSYLTGGWGVSGGVGLELGAYELGVGAAMRRVNGGREPVITVNVLSFR
jgi:hypothetical protein